MTGHGTANCRCLRERPAHGADQRGQQYKTEDSIVQPVACEMNEQEKIL